MFGLEFWNFTTFSGYICARCDPRVVHILIMWSPRNTFNVKPCVSYAIILTCAFTVCFTCGTNSFNSCFAHIHLSPCMLNTWCIHMCNMFIIMLTSLLHMWNLKFNLRNFTWNKSKSSVPAASFSVIFPMCSRINSSVINNPFSPVFTWSSPTPRPNAVIARGENRTEKSVQLFTHHQPFFPVRPFREESYFIRLLQSYSSHTQRMFLLSFLIFAASFSSNFLLDLRNSLMAAFLSLQNYCHCTARKHHAAHLKAFHLSAYD